MDTTTMLGGSRQRTDPPDPREAIEGQRASSGLRAAYLLSAVIAVLMVVASAAGLWLHRLYQDPAWATAAFRGGDLATLLVAAPLLAGALLRSLRGSRRAHLVWLGMLAYSLYNYALYVFGTAFNDLFLLHVALFSLSVFALGLGLANVDVAGIGRGFRPRTPARPISGYLLAVAAVLGGMWSYHALRFAATGKLPQTAFPASGLHLIFTLDLALLVPSLALAAVLLWRRRAWGYLLGTVLSVYGAAYQVNFILATVFQANAHVVGVSGFDPLALLLATAFLLCAALLLGSLQPTTRTPAINAGTASIASRAPGGSVMATTATSPSTRSLTRLLRPRPAAGRRRNAARLGFGAFYLATATFNLTVTLPDAAAPYKHIAHNLAWPGVDWLLLHLVVPAAVPLTVLLVAFEVGVGVLLLSKGQRVRLGLLAAVAFQVSLAPLLSWYELGNVPLVALALVLLARDYDRSVLDLVRR